MGSDVSKSIRTDPTFCHSAKDWVHRDLIFRFCKTWDLKIVNDAIQRYIKTADEKSSVSHSNEDALKDAKHNMVLLLRHKHQLLLEFGREKDLFFNDTALQETLAQARAAERARLRQLREETRAAMEVEERYERSRLAEIQRLYELEQARLRAEAAAREEMFEVEMAQREMEIEIIRYKEISLMTAEDGPQFAIVEEKKLSETEALAIAETLRQQILQEGGTEPVVDTDATEPAISTDTLNDNTPEEEINSVRSATDDDTAHLDSSAKEETQEPFVEEPIKEKPLVFISDTIVDDEIDEDLATEDDIMKESSICVQYIERISSVSAQMEEMDQKLELLNEKFNPPSSGLERRIGWEEYRETVKEIDVATIHKKQDEKRSVHHIATRGYYMEVRDTEAFVQMKEFLKGDIVIPAKKPREEDGYTDDSASDSDSELEDDEEESEEEDEEEEEDEDESESKLSSNSSLGVSSKASSVSSKATPNDKNPQEAVEDDDEIDEEDDDEESKSSSAALSENKEEEESKKALPVEAIKGPTVIKRTPPAAFDPTLRSPIFFGIKLVAFNDPLTIQKKKEEEDLKKEDEIFELKLKLIEAEYEEKKTTCLTRKTALENKKSKRNDIRLVEAARRDNEYQAALRELGDEAEIEFKAAWEVENHKIVSTQENEDREWDIQYQDALNNIAKTEENNENMLKVISEIRAMKHPLRNMRIEFHKAEIKQCFANVLTAKADVQIASEALGATISKYKKRPGQQVDPKARSQILFAEGNIKSKERILEKKNEILKNEEFLLERAILLKSREDTYLPLFEAIVTTVPDETPSLGFKVKELLFAFICGVSSDFMEKSHYIFSAFTTSTNNASRLMSLKTLQDIIQMVLNVFVCIGDLHPTKVSTCDDAMVFAIASSAFAARNISLEFGYMSECDFCSWARDIVTRSKYLAAIMNTPWAFRHTSRYQRQTMAPTTAYTQGLMTMEDLISSAACANITYRPELNPIQKDIIHERALAQGNFDPLKTDYSKYLPTKGQKLHSHSVPLVHGPCYGNIEFIEAQERHEACKMIQKIFRSIQARVYARAKMKKHAFYYAKVKSLEETRDKIASAWRDKAHLVGVSKMKFESKVRLRQVKLRASGHNLTPAQVVMLMTDDETRSALQQTSNRYREMEFEAGYVTNDDVAEADTNGEREAPPPNDLPTALVARLKDVMTRPLAVTQLLESMEAAKSAVEAAEAQDNEASLSEEESSSSSGDDESEESEEDLESALSRQRHLSMRRCQALVWGEQPPELYETGETSTELRLKEQLCMTNAYSSYELFKARLQKLTSSMTDLKTTELMLELPVKRVLLDFVKSFRRSEAFPVDIHALANEIQVHFGVRHHTTRLATCLAQFVATDLNDGLLEVWVQKWLGSTEALLKKSSDGFHDENASISEALASKKAKSATIQRHLQALDPDDREAEIEKMAREVLVSRQNHAAKLRKKAEEALAKYKAAESAVAICVKQQTARVPAPKFVIPEYRMQWHERFVTALKARDVLELQNVISDFKSVATSTAVSILSEYYCPPAASSHSTLAVSSGVLKDGRQDVVRNGHRWAFTLRNIRFKIALDDHDMYDGDDEAAAKVAANAIRASQAYFSCQVFQRLELQLPLACVVDYHGFRVACSVVLPIDRVQWTDSGDAIKRIFQEHVYGTVDKGKHVVCQYKELLDGLAEASAELNIATHDVRGTLDLTKRTLPTAADVKGFLGEAKECLVVHFNRAMPPEAPETVRGHLPVSPRGQSIFWRLLRPEFVRQYKQCLSPDAYSLITQLCPTSAVKTINDVKEATKFLLNDLVKTVAQTLWDQIECMHDDADLSAEADSSLAYKIGDKVPYLASLDITKECHKVGLNMRHTALIRQEIAFLVSGSVTVRFQHRQLLTSRDLTEEVKRGATLLILDKEYVVSTDTVKDPHDSHVITVDPSYTSGPSRQYIRVVAGSIGRKCLRCARRLRTALLSELIKRTLKQLLRTVLRSTLKSTQLLIPSRHSETIVHFINCVTGASVETKAFWDEQVYLGLIDRFGPKAISNIDRQELTDVFRGPWLVDIVEYVLDSAGVILKPQSHLRFKKHPNDFLFASSDIVNVQPLVSHNANCIFNDAIATTLTKSAVEIQHQTYEAVITADEPIGYWRLSERRGSAVVLNTMGKHLQGVYRNIVTLEGRTKLRNDFLCRSANFAFESLAHVHFKDCKRFTPSDVTSYVTFEAWACLCGGGANTSRTVINFGRFSLMMQKNNEWGFVVNMHKRDVIATTVHAKPISVGKAAPRDIPASQSSEWSHVVGTFDGTRALLYVNGNVVGDVDVVSAVTLVMRLEEEEIEAARDEIDVRERLEKAARWRGCETAAADFFKTSSGSEFIKQMAKRLSEEHLYNNKSQKVKKMTKKEALGLAKKKYVKEKYDVELIDIVAEHAAMRKALDDRVEASRQEQSEAGAKPLKIGCVSSAKHESGKNHFVGSLAHVAFYNKCLSHDVIYRHFLAGTVERATLSTYLFNLAKDHFDAALELEPWNVNVIQNTASSVCKSLQMEGDAAPTSTMYSKKVMIAINTFYDMKNTNALAEVIRSLPSSPTVANLFATALEHILKLDSNFFKVVAAPTDANTISMSVRELGGSISKFSLGRLAHDTPEIVKAHASVLSLLLQHDPSFFGTVDLRWMKKLTTPSVIVSLLHRIEDGEDPLEVVLDSNVSDREVEIIAAANKRASSITGKKCTKVTSTGLVSIATHCQFLEAMDFSHTTGITDSGLEAIAKLCGCSALKKLDFQSCFQITDFGLDMLLPKCRNVKVLSLANCEYVTDATLDTLSSCATYLVELNISYCFQITDLGIITFCNATSPKPRPLSKINLEACRRLTNAAIRALATTFGKTLIDINMCFCHKVTSAGVLSVTHSCLSLEKLNCQDMTTRLDDKPFFFDMENDGRPIVDKNMLKSLEVVVLTDCKAVTDNGIAGICHRASSTLRVLNLAGCINITDAGLRFINTDMYNGTSAICQNLTSLDLSYMSHITDVGLKSIIDGCGSTLKGLHLNGCVNLSSNALTQDLVPSCPHLQSIGLAYVRSVNDELLRQMAKYLWVESLVLTRCTSITDDGVSAIAAEFSGLRTLDISGCKLLTDTALISLYNGCKHLKKLSVCQIPTISKSSVVRFKAGRGGSSSSIEIESDSTSSASNRLNTAHIDIGLRRNVATGSGGNSNNDVGDGIDDDISGGKKQRRKKGGSSSTFSLLKDFPFAKDEPDSRVETSSPRENNFLPPL